MNEIQDIKNEWYIIWAILSIKANWRGRCIFFIAYGYNEFKSDLELMDSVLN